MSDKPPFFFYKEIESQNTNYHTLDQDRNIINMKYLNGVSRVNVFIGANNSGKSRFLRNLFKFNANTIANQARWKPSEDLQISQDFFDTAKYVSKPKDIDSANYTNFILDKRKFDKLKNEFNIVSARKVIYIPMLRGFHQYKAEQTLKRGSAYTVTAQNLPQGSSEIRFWEKVGFVEKNDLYSEYTRAIYPDLLKNNIEIYSGQGMYEFIKKDLLGDENQRKNIKLFQEFLSKNFFKGQNILLIPNEKEKVLKVKIGESIERPIYNLGDAVQSLITLFYKIYLTSESIFLIEEPENTLHPGLQRQFIKILYDKEIADKNHQFFLTTHSNHLIDLSLDFDDMSIYRFSSLQDDQKLIEHVDPGDKSVLLEIGVQNSSVFLSNCIIWVEGISDRIYIKSFIDLYKEKHNINDIREGIDYSFLESNGGNITHLNYENEDNGEDIYIKRVVSNSYVVIDSDWTEELDKEEKNKNKKFKRIRKLKKILGKNITVVSGEIENLLSSENIFDACKNRGKQKYKTLEKKDIDQEIIYKTKIGKLIDDVYGDFEGWNPVSSNSGSLKSSLKSSFAKNVVNHNSYEKMSHKAKALAKKIVTHIESRKLSLK